MALTTVGLDLSALFTTGAVAAVALAFALQNILQNFVSGIILLAERSITPLDILVVDGEMVRVERMRIRSTIVRTVDEEEIILPNSTLVQSNVKNLTLADQLFRVRTQVGVAYATDLDRAARVLAEAASSVERRHTEREPRVNLLSFGDSSIVFDVSVWIDDPWELPATRTELNFAVWRALKGSGITIAFPQMDVHIVSNEAGLGAPARG
jgi:small-conductance mechanosensitive channel